MFMTEINNLVHECMQMAMPEGRMHADDHARRENACGWPRQKGLIATKYHVF